ncbi:MAG: hypothetical protein V4567_00565 [Pseudomonadota bacterium]
MAVNTAEAYVGACLAGLGLIQAPRTGVAPLLDDGSLIEVLPKLGAESMPVHPSLPAAPQPAPPRARLHGLGGGMLAPSLVR